MGLIYLPTIGVLFALGIACLFAFNIDKAKHEDNLRRLGELADAGEAAGVLDGEDASATTRVGGNATPLGSKA